MLDTKTAAESPDTPSKIARATSAFRPGIFPPSRFLLALIVLIVASPFLDALRIGRIIEAAMMLLVFVSAMLLVSDRRHVLVALLVAVIPVVVGVCIDGISLRFDHPAFLAASGLFFVGFAIVKLLGKVLTARQVDSEVLSAGIATYLCLGILWSFGYTIIAQAVPGSYTFAPGSGSLESMRGFNSLYFSFCTLTTVGFGDIVPIARSARMLVMTEATCGVFYMTILIARLVAIYSSKFAE
jgi:Ion channel